jgi:5-methylcytosine-specific restriction endonuclease McrA
MDFFEVPENRLLILKREDYKCFYSLQRLDEKNFVVEHVVSRPNGNNSYRNVVAASREINNRKGSMTAEEFLRKLFRDGFLSASELEDRLLKLVRLQAGEIKPVLSQ